jgi:hypothetical protein
MFVLAIMFTREGIGVYLWKLWNRVSNRYGSAHR